MRNAPAVDDARLLDEAVARDSSQWAFNRYDAGSLSQVETLGRAGESRTVRGTYTFNGGDQGWVEAEIVGRRVVCLHYWDTGSCSPPRGAEAENQARTPSDRTVQAGNPSRYPSAGSTAARFTLAGQEQRAFNEARSTSLDKLAECLAVGRFSWAWLEAAASKSLIFDNAARIAHEDVDHLVDKLPGDLPDATVSAVSRYVERRTSAMFKRELFKPSLEVCFRLHLVSDNTYDVMK